MRLILTAPWIGLQCVIGVFPDQTHLFFSFIHCDDTLFNFMLLFLLFHGVQKQKRKHIFKKLNIIHFGILYNPQPQN